MSNEDIYNAAFAESFNIVNRDLNSLEYQSIDDWDSVGHMILISAIESKFNIFMDPEDILDFTSYKKGIDILHKYGIDL